MWRLLSGAGQSYNKWLGDAAKPSHKELLRQAIDRALAQKPASLEDLLRLLEQDGFTVHRRGKTISISAEGWGNNVRFDRLGDGYTLDDLLAVLSGQKEHTPRKQPAPQAAPPKVNLLVDIQAKLQAGRCRICPLGQGVQPQTDGPDPQLPV